MYIVITFHKTGIHKVHGSGSDLGLTKAILIGLVWQYFPDLRFEKRHFIISHKHVNYNSK